MIIIPMYPEVILKMFSVRRINHVWNNIRDCTVFFGVLTGSLAVLELEQKFNWWPTHIFDRCSSFDTLTNILGLVVYLRQLLLNCHNLSFIVTQCYLQSGNLPWLQNESRELQDNSWPFDPAFSLRLILKTFPPLKCQFIPTVATSACWYTEFPCGGIRIA